MSPSIWTRCGAESNLGPLAAAPWRVVEAQHLIATRKLVDSDEEQRLLEDLIERQKPPVPGARELEGLHYLLSTPFRYPPLRYGSRFGTRLERGIWYGADELRTAFAEVAYYRLLFLEGTRADLPPRTVELSAFQATVRTARGVDLSGPAFAAHAGAISSRTRYAAAQRLGREMRAAGAEAFRYVSARDAERGTNLGLLSPAAFGRKRPTVPQTWFCLVSRAAVELTKKDFFRRVSHRFPREQFLVRGELPHPAL